MDKPYIAGGLTLDESWRTIGADTFGLEPHPSASNPVLTALDVTDGTDYTEADSYVADPFVVIVDNIYYCFYEYYWTPAGGGTSDIRYSTSEDGLTWTYQGKCLPTIWGSYPFVFKVDGDWWMLPCPDKIRNEGEITLYRASSFPSVWDKYLVLIDSADDLRDPTPFQYDGNWYILAGNKDDSTLHLYTCPYLYGATWTAHPSSPILTGLDVYRPAGRPIIRASAVDIMQQNDDPYYGKEVRCFRLTDLSPTTVTVSELGTSPLLTGSGGEGDWNEDGMHTLDRINSNISVVDGKVNGPPEVYGIGIYRDAS